SCHARKSLRIVALEVLSMLRKQARKSEGFHAVTHKQYNGNTRRTCLRIIFHLTEVPAKMGFTTFESRARIGHIKNVNLKTYEGPKDRNNRIANKSRLLDDDENPNCQQVRRKKRKYNEISKPPQNIPSINSVPYVIIVSEIVTFRGRYSAIRGENKSNKSKIIKIVMIQFVPKWNIVQQLSSSSEKHYKTRETSEHHETTGCDDRDYFTLKNIHCHNVTKTCAELRLQRPSLIVYVVARSQLVENITQK
ncbi:hypothetical protein L9F63_007203, partial [Diploptera punctata]